MTMIFSTVKRFLMQIGNLLLILLTEKFLLPLLKDSLKNQMDQKWKLFILRKKIEKKEQMSIHDDEKRKNERVEKSLMKKVKIKNEFEKAQEKTKTNHKSPTLSTLWKR